MKFTRFVPQAVVEPLSLERPSTDLRVYLTRGLRRAIESTGEEASALNLIRMNMWINRSRNLAGDTIYVLEADDWGDFTIPAEHAWHFAEFELLFRRLDTIQFAELLGELIEEQLFKAGWVNKRLEEDGLGFQFRADTKLVVEMRTAAEIEILAKAHPVWHSNIRLLVDRMEAAAKSADHAAVLHASASVFETLAKEVVGIPTVQTQTLKSFFDRYRKDSGLPAAILDYVLDLYDRRNVTPLSGHGSLAAPPSLSATEATTLVEMTKAFVTIEYRLKLAGASTGPHASPTPASVPIATNVAPGAPTASAPTNSTPAATNGTGGASP